MPEKVAPVIRIATFEDASLLAEVGRKTFDDAFRDSVSPADMAAYLEKAFSMDTIRAELADPDSLFLLAFLDNHPAGYAKLHFGPAHPDVAGEAPVKLWRLYADSRWYGRGIGATLMAESLRAAWERGGRTLWLTTNIHNQRAIAFYQRWGFGVVGSATFTLGTELHCDHVFAAPIAPPA